jgi:hypothetical protein
VESFSIRVDSSGRIVASFKGHLAAEDGELAAHRVAELLSGEPSDVTFDVREMTSYDSAARVAWQQALWPKRDRLRSIEVLGGNSIIRMGAAAIGLFLGVPVTYVK